MKRAWLVTWEWAGEHARRENRVASILNYRFSFETVAKHMERLYVDSYFTLSERLAYAKSRRHTPYPALGASFGRIHCGHNPFLYGRLVQNIYVEVDSDGNEQLKWDEIPLPDPKPWHSIGYIKQ